MKLFNKTFFSILLIVGIFVHSNIYGQCKKYTKKHCLPTLAPYVHNGQLTSAVLNPGDVADIDMVFNAGKEYRLLVCNQEQIGNVQFKVLDQSRNELYSSNPDEANSYWDFKVENTQSLIIQLSVPDIDKRNQITKLTPNGCVALLVGFKE
ncbi:MAG: hypothetical protein ACPGSL_06120 [Vicingaceae bacterium]